MTPAAPQPTGAEPRGSHSGSHPAGVDLREARCRGVCKRRLPPRVCPQAPPSQPHCYIINTSRLWNYGSCFFPRGILRALAGSYLYSQH